LRCTRCLIALCLLLAGCVGTRSAVEQPAVLAAPPVQTQRIDDVTVSVAILPDDVAQRRYGVDLGGEELQAVWLRIDNGSLDKLWLLVAAMDPGYYSADEAAFLYRKSQSREEFEQLRQRFRDQSVRWMLEPGRVQEGHLILPRAVGGRYLNVQLAGHERLLRFGFAVPLPDGDFDYERLRPSAIYSTGEVAAVGLDGLRQFLESLPCCAADSTGDEEGDPLNVVLIGRTDDVLTTMARSGWSFTHRIDLRSIQREIGAAIAGGDYPVAPVSSLYAFGRKQDFALQRSRSSIAQRNHARFWLAPVTFEGLPVWVGQVSRDIGIKLTAKSVTGTTHVIDPEVDEAREFLLQSLLANSAVERFGFVRAFEPVPLDSPRQNLTDDAYFSDGLRLVVLLADEPVAPERARNLHWEEDAGPIAPGQSRAGSDVDSPAAD
jgi:hypothetical protein